MSRNSTGVTVTSSGCSGTCLIFSIPRQPNVTAADQALGRGGRAASTTARSAGARVDVAAGLVFVALMRLLLGPAARRCGRSGRGTPRRGSAGRARSRRARCRRPRQLGDRLGGAAGVGAVTVSAAGSGSRWTCASSDAREHPLGLVAVAASSSRTCSAPWPTDALSCDGRALGDDLAAVDDRDAVGELVGLVEVLGAEQHGRALRGERADDVPHLVARARVQAGRRLVEEHHLRRHDDARRDVQPAAHAARVVLDQPPGRLGEAERAEQLVGALARRGA